MYLQCAALTSWVAGGETHAWTPKHLQHLTLCLCCIFFIITLAVQEVHPWCYCLQDALQNVNTYKVLFLDVHSVLPSHLQAAQSLQAGLKGLTVSRSASAHERCHVLGTADKNYRLIWFMMTVYFVIFRGHLCYHCHDANIISKSEHIAWEQIH